MASESPFRVKLTREQRVALEERARAYTLPYRDVLRAKIVLLAAEGLQNEDIAARLNTAAKASRFSLPTARGPTLTICICPRIRFPSQKLPSPVSSHSAFRLFKPFGDVQLTDPPSG